jgi:hypothetical protein
LTVVLDCKIFTEHPATAAVPADVTPRFVAQTTLDVDRLALGNDVDTWKLNIRARSQIDVGHRKCPLSVRCHASQCCPGNQDRNHSQPHRQNSSFDPSSTVEVRQQLQGHAMMVASNV